MAMGLPTNELLREVSKLTPVQQMRVSVNTAVKAGAAVGAVTIISGILGGPLGLAAGGIISSCIAGYKTQGRFQSVPYILLNETNDEQREVLATAVRSCISSRHITTITDLVYQLQNNQDLMEAVVQVVIMFLSSELGRSVIM